MRKPHLALRKAGESARPPGRGARPEKADRDPIEFCRMQARLLDAMRESYERDRDAAPPYMDPSLIFKIELLSGVHDDTFRVDLKRAGINTIASAPDRDGIGSRSRTIPTLQSSGRGWKSTSRTSAPALSTR